MSADIESFKPFRVHFDTAKKRWVAIAENPADADDFVVPYETDAREDAEVVCSALNDVLRSHLRHFLGRNEDER